MQATTAHKNLESLHFTFSPSGCQERHVTPRYNPAINNTIRHFNHVDLAVISGEHIAYLLLPNGPTGSMKESEI